MLKESLDQFTAPVYGKTRRTPETYRAVADRCRQQIEWLVQDYSTVENNHQLLREIRNEIDYHLRRYHEYCIEQRDGMKAIFQQTRDDSSLNNYEVVKIGRHNGYNMGGSFIEPAETYPGSSLWGITGWTCTSIDSALSRYEQLPS